MERQSDERHLEWPRRVVTGVARDLPMVVTLCVTPAVRTYSAAHEDAERGFLRCTVLLS